MNILYGIAIGGILASIIISDFGWYWYTPMLWGLAALSLALFVDHLMIFEMYNEYKKKRDNE